MGGGLNDSEHIDRVNPDQYREAENIRILPNMVPEKLSGREFIVRGIGSEIKDIAVPRRRIPLVTLTSANNRLAFKYDGISYVAIVAEGIYYNHEELAAAIQAAMIAQAGAGSFAVTWARTYTAPATVRYGKIGWPHSLLKTTMNDSVNTVEVNFGSDGRDFDDWRTGGVHVVRIDSEEMSYTGKTDNTTYVTLTGVVREINGTVAAAHTAGAKVRMHYSAMSDLYRGEFLAIGIHPDNDLDSDGDGKPDVTGYSIGVGS